MNSIGTFNTLSEEIKKSLKEAGYHELTSIQDKIIPLIMQGNDIIAQSGTGTGKTASFIVPLIEKLEINVANRAPRALVLVPTRELALQVAEETKKLTKYKRLRTVAVFGGENSMRAQLNSFRRGVDIIIGTPGRVIHHLEEKNFSVKEIKFLVLDEVDEMINVGFLPSIEKIIKKIPSERQTLLLSATVDLKVANFAKIHSKEPIKVIEKTTQNLFDVDVKHYCLEIDQNKKIFYLSKFIASHSSKLIIVFANTKRRVEFITKNLLENK